MFYQESVLDNGVTVISERIPSVRSVSVGIWFCVGSRDESEREQGISHFMEHMMFKGTERRDAFAISEAFESIGAEQNAFTSKEYTCYYSRFIDERLTEVMDILGDMVTASVFDQSSIDPEREVVIEEIARSEDTPDDYIFELFTKAAYPHHPLGRPIIGSREVVGGFMRPDCLAWRDKHYHAGNCIAIAAGNVEHEDFVAACARQLGTLPAGRRNPRDTVDAGGWEPFAALEKDTEQAHIIYGMEGLALGDPDRFAGSLLDAALGGGMSSRLFQEVREKRGLAYAVYASTMPYRGAAQFLVYAGTRPSNMEEVCEIITREVGKVLAGGLEPDELERVREYLIGHIVLSMESTSQRMLRLGKSVLGGVEMLSLDELVENYRRVTLADIKRVAERVLSASPTLAVISPRATDELASSLAPFLAPGQGRSAGAARAATGQGQGPR
ncbi:MAG: insulinase family protein [Coriobacteriales bacterium]|jgi:predicted Zn-dependent peptidase|nr:insulinase family protein [Coriobacteriales bacterium]